MTYDLFEHQGMVSYRDIKMKVVSVIVPIYKGKHYIPNLLRILEDNWLSANKWIPVEIELVLVNDYPSERLNLEDFYAKHISLVAVENQQNRGIHFSRIEGLRCAGGDYIVFLDQDDEISPVYIREQLTLLEDNDAVICNGKNRSGLIYRSKEDWQNVLSREEYRNGRNRIVSPGQVLLRRSAIPEEWLNNIIKQNGADDYFLWMLMFYQDRKMIIQEKCLYWHSISDNNTSGDAAGMRKSVFETAAKMRELGYLTCEEEQKIIGSRSLEGKEEDISIAKHQKLKKYICILELWMALRDRRITVEAYLLKRKKYKVAIYGGGILGRHLYYELKDSSIQVVCILDRNEAVEIEGTKRMSPGDSIEDIDVIIVTPIMEYKEIAKQLRDLYACDIFSLETILLNADYKLMEK